MTTWTFESMNNNHGGAVTAVVSAESVELAMQLLKQEFERLGIVLYATFDYTDLIPLPTQTRKVRILSNGE